MKDNQQKVKEERMDTSESQLGGAVTQSQTPKEVRFKKWIFFIFVGTNFFFNIVIEHFINHL